MTRSAGGALEVLFETAPGPAETAAEQRYGAPLRFPDADPPGAAPYIVSNFVSTIDGVVSLGLHDGSDSARVGGSSPADRYVMAMLRAAADAIVIGARTLADSAGQQWTPDALVAEPVAADLAGYRRALGRDGSAPLVIVSASGRLPAHVALSRPATETAVVGGLEPLLALCRERGWRLLLTEGGPTLLGALVAADAVSELFVTIAPHVAGRDAAHPRPGMVQGFAAAPDALRACELVSARRAEAHLFLRYRRRR